MRVTSATIFGLIIGLAVGIVSIGQVVALNPQVGAIIHQDAWWIVVLSMVPPLYDYLTGVRTTMLGMVTRHPYRHVAGFFAGLSVGLGFFLLLSPKVVSALALPG
jgi:hypothetical protein